MRLTQATAPVINSGAGLRTAEFSMKMNEKMFEIFSSSIYSNKIRAMVRELCTNAFDIHKTVGKQDVPFRVTIPVPQDPMFVVRDYGTGLSEEQIFKIYTVYFESTKDNDDESHGGYGLGSKSPLAYVDSFQIRSYQNGVLKCYTCYRKNGIPFISLILETATSEEDGLEVSVAVNESDMRRFNIEIGYVLSTFPVMPIIVNGSKFETFDFKKNTNNMYTIKNFLDVVDRENKFFVYVEPVLYPVRGDLKSILEKSTFFKFFFSTSASERFAFQFPIGALDIPPSREQLDNTPNNITQFQNFIDEIDKNSMKTLTDIYESSKDLDFFSAKKFVAEEIKKITGVEKSALYEKFTNHHDFLYKNPLGTVRVSINTVVDPVTGAITKNKVNTELSKTKLSVYSAKLVSRLFAHNKAPFFKNTYYESKGQITMSYESTVEDLIKYIDPTHKNGNAAKFTLFLLNGKNYVKFLKQHKESVLKKYDADFLYFMLDETVSSAKEKMDEFSPTGSLATLFPNHEIVSWDDLIKDFPFQRTAPQNMTKKGTKEHDILILNNGVINDFSISINDLYARVDDAGGELQYISATNVLLTSELKNLFKVIKKSKEMSDYLKDFFAVYEDVLIFNNNKFDNTITRLNKSSTVMDDVTENFLNELKVEVKNYFSDSGNWKYKSLKTIAEQLEYDDVQLFKHGLKWLSKLRADNLFEYLKKYDPVNHRRITSGDSTLALLNNMRENNFLEIITDNDYQEWKEQHTTASDWLFKSKMLHLSKKLPMMVAFVGERVYTGTNAESVLIDYMKQQGV